MTTSTRPATVQHDPARATPRRRVPAASVQGTLALDLGRGGGEAVPLHRLGQ